MSRISTIGLGVAILGFGLPGLLGSAAVLGIVLIVVGGALVIFGAF